MRMTSIDVLLESSSFFPNPSSLLSNLLDTMESTRYTICNAPLRKTIAAKRKRKMIDDDWMESEVPTVGPPTPICCIIRICQKHKDVEEEKRADEEVKMIVEASILCQETMPEA